LSALLALLTFFLVKRFLIDVVRVNGDDMRDSLRKGDAVLVNRNPGSIVRGDIVYIRFPISDSSSHPHFFQRIAALPGDTVQISYGELLVNNLEVRLSDRQKFNYFVRIREGSDSTLFAQYGADEGGSISSKEDFCFALRRSQVSALAHDTRIENMELRKEKKGNFDPNCFPYERQLAWNKYHYGKIFVPCKSCTLSLDKEHLPLYSRLVRDYEGNELQVRNDSAFINGSYATLYKVRKNYFFVIGDNFDNANDSRSWGFLPFSDIRGKYICTIRKAR
jgi:signal peptidase I